MVSDVVYTGLSAIQIQILQIMKNRPRITARQLSEIVDINTRNVQDYIKSLKMMGFVKRIGSEMSR